MLVSCICLTVAEAFAPSKAGSAWHARYLSRCLDRLVNEILDTYTYACIVNARLFVPAQMIHGSCRICRGLLCLQQSKAILIETCMQ